MSTYAEFLVRKTRGWQAASIPDAALPSKLFPWQTAIELKASYAKMAARNLQLAETVREQGTLFSSQETP